MPTKKITRAVRFEITFPGWRSKDLFGLRKDEKKGKTTRRRPAAAGDGEGGDASSKDPGGLYRRLWAMQRDLTGAANRLVSALWQVRIGTLTWPLKEEGGERVPLQSLAYQGLSGKWRPFGAPLYVPSTPDVAVSSAVLLDLATSVHDRLHEDYVEIIRGKRSLPAFKGLPIGLTKHGVEVRDNGDIELRLWPGRGQNSLVLAPRKIDDSARSILRRCAAGAFQSGGAKLSWVAPEGRKGKWMLSVQWTGDVVQAEGPLFAGLDIGLAQSATLCYLSTETGKAQRRTDILRLPANVMRGWRRWEAMRRERGESNRAVYGRRAGRGVARKLRSVQALSDSQRRLVDEEVAQLAAAIVRQAKAAGAVGIALEDLTTWSVGRLMDEKPDGTNAARAEHRKRYLLAWHQGAIRAKVKEVAEREGLFVAVVDARHSSRTCAACGVVYPDVCPGKSEGATHGYLRWDLFSCACGYHAHGERNAAIVLAQRGLERWRKANAEGPAPVATKGRKRKDRASLTGPSDSRENEVASAPPAK